MTTPAARLRHDRWDYIVVGGSSAGCVIAARLSEDPARSVLLVEAGGHDWSPRIRIPGLVESLLFNRTYNWLYEGEPDPSLNDRRLLWAAGRVLGGSSSINGMVYGRGLSADYDRWVAKSLTDWSWHDMLPWFKKLEDWTGPVSPSRGRGGPLAVRRFEDPDASCRGAMAHLISEGVPYVEDYCTGISEGIG